MEQKDIRLIERAIKGDPGAFSKLIQKKSSNITYITWSILRNFHDAQDAAQDAMALMYRYIGNLKAPEAFDSWMYKIVYRSCLDVKKDKQAKVSIADIPEENLREKSAEMLPHQHNENEENRRVLLEQIERLPEKYRLCLYLYYFEDLSYKEIAEALDGSVQDVSNWLNRARKKLRVELGQSGMFDEEAGIPDADLIARAPGALLVANAFAYGVQKTVAVPEGKELAGFISRYAKTLGKLSKAGPAKGVGKGLIASLVVLGAVLALAGGAYVFSGANEPKPIEASQGRSATAPAENAQPATASPSEESTQDAPAEPQVEVAASGVDPQGGPATETVDIAIENTAYCDIVDSGGAGGDGVTYSSNGAQVHVEVEVPRAGTGSQVASSPAKTGDNLGVGPMIAGLFVSATTIIVIFVLKCRKRTSYTY